MLKILTNSLLYQLLVEIIYEFVFFSFNLYIINILISIMIQKIMNLVLIIFVFSAFNSFAQTTVTGTISDSTDGMGLPSVTVLEKGTSNGTTSDFNGKFTIEI